jgi:hypothetical protein
MSSFSPSNPQVYLPGERRLKTLLGTGETNYLFLKRFAAATIEAQKGIFKNGDDAE